MLFGSQICSVYSTYCDKFYIHGPQKFSSQMVAMELKMYSIKFCTQLRLFRYFAATKIVMDYEMSKKNST